MPASLEHSIAKLEPFDLDDIPSGPLTPIKRTKGLNFQYSPDISETIKINYATAGDIVHSNENYHVYKNTDNRRISLSGITFTADTIENARYLLAAIHFFRSYSLMDYGSGKSGRPPAPMWFSAYGPQSFERQPVLMEQVEIKFDKDVDMVGIPTGGSVSSTRGATRIIPAVVDGQVNRVFADANQARAIEQGVQQAGSRSDYTWVPVKLEIGSVQFIVQRSPKYWKNQFGLDDYRSGRLLKWKDRNTSSASAARRPIAGLDPSSAEIANSLIDGRGVGKALAQASRSLSGSTTQSPGNHNRIPTRRTNLDILTNGGFTGQGFSGS